MRAIVIEQLGGPEVLTEVEVDRPSPAPGQVLVEVAVSGVNFLDIYQRTGATPLPPPFGAGVEGVGVVAEVGRSVTDLHVGQRMGWFSGGQGSFADAVVVVADKAVPIPDEADDEAALAVLMQGVTGDKVEAARAAGADHVLGYEEFAEQARQLTDGVGVAAVYDGVGASTFGGSLAALRQRGLLIIYGTASGPTPPLEMPRLNSGGSLYVTRPSVVHYTATAEELRGAPTTCSPGSRTATSAQTS